MPFLAGSACILGFLGVTLGAFGAHGLKSKLTAESLAWWETATLYALVHAVAILAISAYGTAAGAGGKTFFTGGGWVMAVGVLIFSGTLYAMALGAPRWFGAITPLGGLCLLAGWAAAGAGAFLSAPK